MCIVIFVELKAFLQFVTGAPVPVGKVFVTFDDDEQAEALSANTCGKQLTLCTCISDQHMFTSAMKAIISEETFTMP